MNRKLTLSLDETIIHQAKHYAARHRLSLSGLVEKYFKYIIAELSGEDAQTSLPHGFKDLVGIVRLPKNIDIKQEYRRSRADKALHE